MKLLLLLLSASLACAVRNRRPRLRLPEDSYASVGDACATLFNTTFPENCLAEIGKRLSTEDALSIALADKHRSKLMKLEHPSEHELLVLKQSCGLPYYVDIALPAASIFISGRKPVNLQCFKALEQRNLKPQVKNLYLKPGDAENYEIENAFEEHAARNPWLEAITLDVSSTYSYERFFEILQKTQVKKLNLRLMDDCLESFIEPLTSLALESLEIDARKVSIADNEHADRFKNQLKTTVSGISSLKSFKLVSPADFYLDSLDHENLQELTIRDRRTPAAVVDANNRHFDANALPSLKSLHVGRIVELTPQIADVHINSDNSNELLRVKNSIKSLSFMNLYPAEHDVFREFCEGNNVVESFSTQFMAPYDLSPALYAENLSNFTVTMSHFPIAPFTLKQQLLDFLSAASIKRFDLVWETFLFEMDVDFVAVSFQNLARIVDVVAQSSTIKEFNLMMKTQVGMGARQADMLADVLTRLVGRDIKINGHSVDRVINDLRSLARENVELGNMFHAIDLTGEQKFSEVEKLL